MGKGTKSCGFQELGEEVMRWTHKLGKYFGGARVAQYLGGHYMATHIFQNSSITLNFCEFYHVYLIPQ